MSEDEEPKSTPPDTSPPAMNTRGQRKANEKANDRANNDDNDTSGDSINKKKEKDKQNDNYKGKVTKMFGNVFQLPEETRKANQFTLTLEALHDYANIEFDNASDLAPFFNTPCKNATVPTPNDEPPFDATGTSRVKAQHRLYIEWKYACEKYNERMADLKTNKLKLFTTILMQCSPGVETKLKSNSLYDNAKKTNDCEWLLTCLKDICNRFEHTENRFVALVLAKSNLFNYKQFQNQSTTDYYEIFKEMLSVLESYGGKLHDPYKAAPTSCESVCKAFTDEEKDNYMRERYAAILFLKNADTSRYESLRLDLANGFSKGRDEYPTTLVDTYQLLLTHKTNSPKKNTPYTNQHHSGRGRGNGNGNNGRGRGDESNQPGSGRGQQSGGRTGGRTGKSMTQVRLLLAQTEDNMFFPNGIPDHYILLDSDSTVSIFNNANLLTNIREATEPLFLETNGDGKQTSTLIGTIDGFGDVWYNPDSIANILSLAEVRRLRRVTMDTNITPAFHVHRLDGSGYTSFEEHASGLYLLDTSKEINVNNNKECVFAYSYLQTVANNKQHYTKRQVDAADKTRELYRMIGRPSHARFLDILKNNLVINCPLTVDDAIRAEHIYGKDVAFLKGKTTADSATDHIPDQPQIALPPEFPSLHSNVTLCFDIFYILGLPFLLSTSRGIRYLSCRPLRTRSKTEIAQCIRADLQTYQDRGFNPITIHADGEFNPFKNMFPGLQLVICAADAHVPEIERAIRTVKETIRSTIHGMPYHRLPRVMIRELASMAVRTINMLPHCDGVSPTLSPLTIVTGLPKPDYNTFKLEFGAYVQVYDGTSNDTKSRTLGAIATNPTGNVSGDHFFMSLATGQRIHRRSWTMIPISDSTVSRVEAIASEENMPLVDHDHMINEYDPDDIVDDSAYDRTYQPTADHASDHEMTTDAYTDTDDSDTDSNDDVGHSAVYDDEPLPPTTTVAPRPTRHVVFNETRNTTYPPTPYPALDHEERTNLHDNEERTTLHDTAERTHIPPTIGNEERTIHDNEERKRFPPSVNKEERRTPPTVPTLPTTSPVIRKSGLRPQKDRSYQHRFNFTQLSTNITTAIDTIPDVVSPSLQKAIIGLMFTQMSASKGIKKYGQAALDALRKEFEQFKTMDAFEPLDAFTMTDDQKADALRALSLITEKRDGILKGRTCADGSTQQGKYSKAETGSPTVATDALFLTVLIDAIEHRDVATADVKGAYLHAFMKDFIAMRFTGWAVDLLCEVNPEYSKYIVYENNVKVLYVRCNKAIYGCVVSGVLWYELFSTTLEQHGFTVNPYDFCVANAIIDGSQCTIAWYVDDTKISHINPTVVTNIITKLEHHFGKMKVTRGHVHQFLGMTITYLADGTATIHMPSYITNAITDSGLDITRSSPTPCANTLLEVDDTSPLLPLSTAKIFHSTVAKLIYVGTRARTDILLALGFLCGRVSAPTKQDNKKLRRLLEYLHGTVDLPLHLGADSLTHFTTWVDASFAIHHDMRSHTGGVISFGRGGIICKSRKQHIATKSSTEAELVGASDYLPNTIYVKEFMAHQGYPIKTATFLQDNESAIKLEQNGKASAGQRSRHINIRYFFITDHAKRQSITIQHCPTEYMLADFFTKPLQGSLFKKFRSALLGLVHTNDLLPPPINAERGAC